LVKRGKDKFRADRVKQEQVLWSQPGFSWHLSLRRTLVPEIIAQPGASPSATQNQPINWPGGALSQSERDS
jgi:hypothetical protein